MTKDQEIFEAMVTMIREKIPGFEIKYKNEDLLSKVIGVLVWLFNKTYMTQYITTLYPCVLFPTRASVEKDYRSAWKILAHEFVHLWDRQQRGFVFTLAYALPQLAALLAIPAGAAIWFGPWMLPFLAALLCLAPWPSPGRMHIEYRGYVMSIAVDYWRYGTLAPGTQSWIVEQFTGFGYYLMWPFRTGMQARFDAAAVDLSSGKIFEWEMVEPYQLIHDLLKAQGVAVK